MRVFTLNKVFNYSWKFIKYYSFFHVTKEYVFPIRFLICNGSSMKPTLNDFDVVLTEKRSVRKRRIVKNDVVIAADPRDHKAQICKRVVGLAGDYVVITDNSKENEEYDEVYSVCVPGGKVFLLGDNLKDSYDSRHFGTVPYGLLKSRVFLKIWPLSDIMYFPRQEEEKVDE